MIEKLFLLFKLNDKQAKGFQKLKRIKNKTNYEKYK
jgi:hypothetical protein